MLNKRWTATQICRSRGWPSIALSWTVETCNCSRRLDADGEKSFWDSWRHVRVIILSAINVFFGKNYQLEWVLIVIPIRYEAGLLFAYLAFVPFCEAGAMDSLSLRVSLSMFICCFLLLQVCYCISMHMPLLSFMIQKKMFPHPPPASIFPISFNHLSILIDCLSAFTY